MNFITMLKKEHKETKDLFKEILEAEKIDHEKTKQLSSMLLMHMENEEKHLYPVMEKHKEVGDITKEAELEHKEGKKVIKELMGGKLDDVEYKVKLEILQLEIEHHVEEEEKELFPKCKELLSDEDIKAISEKMMAFKEKKSETIHKA